MNKLQPSGPEKQIFDKFTTNREPLQCMNPNVKLVEYIDGRVN